MKQHAKNNKEKHEFALFCTTISTLVNAIENDQTFLLTDENLVKRMSSILRLEKNQTCILFNKKINVHCSILEYIGKKQIRLTLLNKKNNTDLFPHITFLLPLLKRDDLETTLYSLTEIGINTIQLVTTQKTQGSWNNYKDTDRIDRIIIAAAEQSKNFSYPTLLSPIPLLQALSEKTSTKLFFDPHGESFFTIMNTIFHHHTNNITLLIGPEGDLTTEEKNLLKNHNFTFCTLTPTVLRATQAASLGAGFIRSLLPCTTQTNVFK